ncbi:hypothetical protein PR048_015042 [Dryococelus australis]|uniref:Uncharacterized protein n=1 Tax=Dryococelus australis TaxID=614101 RepID=A0ABQ9HFV1_9NEOP|nr:hypothetical protein PR048_015042 [Dryococelus australis]
MIAAEYSETDTVIDDYSLTADKNRAECYGDFSNAMRKAGQPDGQTDCSRAAWARSTRWTSLDSDVTPASSARGGDTPTLNAEIDRQMDAPRFVEAIHFTFADRRTDSSNCVKIANCGPRYLGVPNIEVWRVDEGEARRVWSSAGMKRRGGGGHRENPPTSDIVRHNSHMRKSGSDPTGNRTRKMHDDVLREYIMFPTTCKWTLHRIYEDSMTNKQLKLQTDNKITELLDTNKGWYWGGGGRKRRGGKPKLQILVQQQNKMGAGETKVGALHECVCVCARERVLAAAFCNLYTAAGNQSYLGQRFVLEPRGTTAGAALRQQSVNRRTWRSLSGKLGTVARALPALQSPNFWARRRARRQPTDIREEAIAGVARTDCPPYEVRSTRMARNWRATGEDWDGAHAWALFWTLRSPVHSAAEQRIKPGRQKLQQRIPKEEPTAISRSISRQSGTTMFKQRNDIGHCETGPDTCPHPTSSQGRSQHGRVCVRPPPSDDQLDTASGINNKDTGEGEAKRVWSSTGMQEGTINGRSPKKTRRAAKIW